MVLVFKTIWAAFLIATGTLIGVEIGIVIFQQSGLATAVAIGPYFAAFGAAFGSGVGAYFAVATTGDAARLAHSDDPDGLEYCPSYARTSHHCGNFPATGQGWHPARNECRQCVHADACRDRRRPVLYLPSMLDRHD